MYCRERKNCTPVHADVGSHVGRKQEALSQRGRTLGQQLFRLQSSVLNTEGYESSPYSPPIPVWMKSLSSILTAIKSEVSLRCLFQFVVAVENLESVLTANEGSVFFLCVIKGRPSRCWETKEETAFSQKENLRELGPAFRNPVLLLLHY